MKIFPVFSVNSLMIDKGSSVSLGLKKLKMVRDKKSKIMSLLLFLLLLKFLVKVYFDGSLGDFENFKNWVKRLIGNFYDILTVLLPVNSLINRCDLIISNSKQNQKVLTFIQVSDY